MTIPTTKIYRDVVLDVWIDFECQICRLIECSVFGIFSAAGASLCNWVTDYDSIYQDDGVDCEWRKNRYIPQNVIYQKNHLKMSEEICKKVLVQNGVEICINYNGEKLLIVLTRSLSTSAINRTNLRIRKCGVEALQDLDLENQGDIYDQMRSSIREVKSEVPIEMCELLNVLCGSFAPNTDHVYHHVGEIVHAINPLIPSTNQETVMLYFKGSNDNHIRGQIYNRSNVLCLLMYGNLNGERFYVSAHLPAHGNLSYDANILFYALLEQYFAILNSFSDTYHLEKQGH